MPMGPAAEQLLQAALALPEDERLELTEALLASQGESSELPFDPAWLAEIQRLGRNRRRYGRIDHRGLRSEAGPGNGWKVDRVVEVTA